MWGLAAYGADGVQSVIELLQTTFGRNMGTIGAPNLKSLTRSMVKIHTLAAMKFALLTVSYSGLFYAGNALSLDEQIPKAKALGFDALAIEAKRPVASPLDLSKADRSRMKALAADQGIALCAVESMSNFAGRLMEERENNLAMMRAVLDLASDLGVDLVKVFAAWPGLINDEEAVAMYAPYERGQSLPAFVPARSPQVASRGQRSS